jgi:DNA-binding GntR family transcriptional regulator
MLNLVSPIKPQSLVDELARRLEAAIFTGELTSGEWLSEASLAAALGVSRGPLREAIRRLEGRKLLVREPNLGPRVASVSIRDVEELLVIREALEGMACRLATQAMTDAEIAALADANTWQVGDAAGPRDLLDYYRGSAGPDFHVQIVRACGNERLAELLFGDPFHLLRLYRYRSAATPGRLVAGRAEHRAILAAMAARDGEAAERLMRKHLQQSRQATLASLRKAEKAGAAATAVNAGPRKRASVSA